MPLTHRWAHPAPGTAHTKTPATTRKRPSCSRLLRKQARLPLARPRRRTLMSSDISYSHASSLTAPPAAEPPAPALAPPPSVSPAPPRSSRMRLSMYALLQRVNRGLRERAGGHMRLRVRREDSRQLCGAVSGVRGWLSCAAPVKSSTRGSSATLRRARQPRMIAPRDAHSQQRIVWVFRPCLCGEAAAELALLGAVSGRVRVHGFGGCRRRGPRRAGAALLLLAQRRPVGQSLRIKAPRPRPALQQRTRICASMG